MQQTQKQSTHEARLCELRERISTTATHIDQTIQAYLYAKQFYPEGVRAYLRAIETAISWLRYNEEALEILEANPDLPF